MGRPKGSRNVKKNRPVVGNPIPTEGTNVPSQPDPSPAQDEVEAPAEVAPAAPAEGGEAAGAVIETLAEVVEIAPPTMPAQGRLLDEIGHELAKTDGEKRALESEKSEVMKDYNKRIGVLDARCAELAAEYIAAERPESYDYKAGWRFVWDGRTGRLIDRIALGSGVQLPLVERPRGEESEPQPPRATFADLVDGKVWEHAEHGYCRILAVLEDSVRVQTEDLDEDEAGIEITREDWDSAEAHPREVPELDLEQEWVIEGRKAVITGLDDFAALVTWTETDEPARVARLTFCGAKRAGEEAVEETESAPIPELEEGTCWHLADDGTEGCKLVTITSFEVDAVLVKWASSGLGGRLPRDAFAGAVPATQEEIDTAFVAPVEANKRGRKRSAGAEG